MIILTHNQFAFIIFKFLFVWCLGFTNSTAISCICGFYHLLAPWETTWHCFCPVSASARAKMAGIVSKVNCTWVKKGRSWLVSLERRKTKKTGEGKWIPVEVISWILSNRFWVASSFLQKLIYYSSNDRWNLAPVSSMATSRHMLFCY